MGCQNTKCSKPECKTYMKACQLLQGMCPTCYQKQQQLNGTNTTQTNPQYPNQ